MKEIKPIRVHARAADTYMNMRLCFFSISSRFKKKKKK
jgi:hypothetical protein